MEDLLEKGLLSVKDVGRILGVSAEIAYKRMTRGDVPGVVRWGGRIYARGPMLRRWLNGEPERGPGRPPKAPE